jgi:hypothetical protein
MNERISFVVLLSCGLRETSSVDYTDFEDLKILREKSFCMFPHYITCGPPQRREEVLREILIIIFMGGD